MEGSLSVTGFKSVKETGLGGEAGNWTGHRGRKSVLCFSDLRSLERRVVLIILSVEYGPRAERYRSDGGGCKVLSRVLSIVFSVLRPRRVVRLGTYPDPFTVTIHLLASYAANRGVAGGLTCKARVCHSVYLVWGSRRGRRWDSATELKTR
ncbi:hypothetical protein PM082_016564 [Marasmius tenuissimus]|nr:hypothetical protein PM082_016564 [Marasmius tenuissimus]